MTTPSIEAPPDRPALLIRIMVVNTVLALLGTVVLLFFKRHDFAAAAARMGPAHLPTLAALRALPALVQVHFLMAVAAVGLGVFMMASRKGKTFHRIVGWIWATLVMSIAVSSLFLHSTITGGRWGPLHLGSAWVIVFLPVAVIAARRHRVASHRALMMLIFYGTLLISGALTFLPGRIMWQMIFG